MSRFNEGKSAAEDAQTGDGRRHEMRMLARAASILNVLAEHPGGMSLGQIAKATGLARATVQRLVGALEAEKWAATGPRAGSVRLGVGLVRLGAAVNADMRRLLRPFLEALHDRVEDTVDLTKFVHGEVIVLEQIASPRALRVVSHVGQALPLHATASGKAHLTLMNRSEAARALGADLTTFTEHTLTDVAPLLALADTAGERRCLLDAEECFEGVSAIGLPIRGVDGESYAVAVSMPSQRFADRLDFLTDELTRCQRAIEKAIGCV